MLVVASRGLGERTIPTRNDSYVEKRTIPTRKILKSVGSPWEVRGKSVGSGQTEILNQEKTRSIFAALAEITVVMCIELYKSAKMINKVFDKND